MKGVVSAVFVVATLSAGSALAADLAVLPVVGNDGVYDVTTTELLRQSVVGFGIDVLSGDDTDTVIADAAAFSAPCDAREPACALQLGGIAGVRRVVVGVVTPAQIQLRLYDVAAEREVDNAFVAVGDNAGRATRLAAVRLLRPDLELGALHVSVDIAGAAIVVDGQQRGLSPSSTMSLKPGKHEVYVSHVDFESQTFAVDVDFAATTQLSVTLDPSGHHGVVSGPVGDGGGDGDGDSGGDDDVALTRVFVLDVVGPGYGPLGQGLATVAAVEALQCLEGVLVVTPSDLSALVDEATATTLSACRADACWTQTLLDRFGAGEVVIIDADRGVDGLPVSGRRYDLEYGVVGVQVVTGAARPEDLVDGVRRLVRALYPDPPVRQGAQCGEDVAKRLTPPPLSVSTFGITAAATGVSALATAGAFVGAAVIDDRLLAGAYVNLGITAAVVTGVGVLVTVLEVPAVDWDDVAGQNDALVKDTVARSVVRRLGPDRVRRRPRGTR